MKRSVIMNELLPKGYYAESEILDLSNKTAEETREELSRTNLNIKLLILPLNEDFDLEQNQLMALPNLDELIWPKASKMQESLFKESPIKYASIGCCPEISKNAFSQSQIEWVSIGFCPEIGPGAFRECKNLESIIMPTNLKVIKEMAFSKCVSLKKVDLSSVKGKVDIKYDAFISTKSLQEFDFKKIASIGEKAFMASGLKEAIFKRKTQINSLAFSESDVCYVEFNKDVTFNEGYQFSVCEKLKKANLNNVDKVSYGCFESCDKLESVIGAQKTTYIGSESFSGTNITELDIPKVNQIGEYAFSGSNLKSITLYANNISDFIFNNCRNLKCVIFNSKIKDIPCNTFNGCLNLDFVDMYNTEIETIYSGTFSVMLSEVKLPQNLKVIKYRAFAKSKLKSVFIPDSVICIESCAFGYCEFLSEVRWSKKCSDIPRGTFINCKNLKTFTNAENIKRIDSDAFAYTNVNIILKDIESIAKDAFDGCNGQVDLRQSAILLTAPLKCREDIVLLPYFY